MEDFQTGQAQSCKSELCTDGGGDGRCPAGAACRRCMVFWKKHEKPTIGDAVRPVEIEDIARANKLLYAASLLGMIVFCGIRIAVWFGIKMEL